MGDINWDSLGRHPAPGDTIEGYTLEAAIGAGGMASVYRATAQDGSVIALKILNPARVLPEERRRFTREYNALARMNHPNIVRVFKAGVYAGCNDGSPWSTWTAPSLKFFLSNGPKPPEKSLRTR